MSAPITKPTLMNFEITIESEDALLKFKYNNWRNEDHEYVIELEGFEIGPYDKSGKHPNMEEREDNLSVVLHGMVVTRDGDPRPDMGTRRRTFLVKDMTHIRFLARSK